MSCKNFNLLLIILSLSAFLTKVSGHGNGAPLSRCETMTPGHWISPQTVPSPFQIFVDRENVTEGDKVAITLISADKHEGFKGFLVMVKKTGVDSENYGQFDLQRSDLEKSQPLTCFNREGSAMTHVDNSEKRFVHLEWIAPKVTVGEEQVFQPRATIVQNFWTIWTNLTAQNMIRVIKSSDSNPRRPVEIAKVVQHNLPKSDLPDEPFSTTTEAIKNGATGVKDSEGQGSWTHFKRSWMHFLQRMGF